MERTGRFAAGVFAGIIAGCGSTSHEEDRVWMSYRPVQCLGNAWEQAWLAEGNAYENFPRDLLAEGFTSDEGRIIKNYFAEEGVVVRDISTMPLSGTPCASCDCPIGYTLLLNVDDSDAGTLEDFGFSVSTR